MVKLITINVFKLFLRQVQWLVLRSQHVKHVKVAAVLLYCIGQATCLPTNIPTVVRQYIHVFWESDFEGRFVGHFGLNPF